MQVLCHISRVPASNDILCPICNQGFKLYWERSGSEERNRARTTIHQALRDQHVSALDGNPAHPETPFNIPSWNGLPCFSGAALLGGLPDKAA